MLCCFTKERTFNLTTIFVCDYYSKTYSWTIGIVICFQWIFCGDLTFESPILRRLCVNTVDIHHSIVSTETNWTVRLCRHGQSTTCVVQWCSHALPSSSCCISCGYRWFLYIGIECVLRTIDYLHICNVKHILISTLLMLCHFYYRVCRHKTILNHLYISLIL